MLVALSWSIRLLTQANPSLEPNQLLGLSLAGAGPPGSAACFKPRRPFGIALAENFSSPGYGCLHMSPEFSAPRSYGLKSRCPLAVPGISTYSMSDTHNPAHPKPREMSGLSSPPRYCFHCLIPTLHFSPKLPAAPSMSLQTLCL